MNWLFNHKKYKKIQRDLILNKYNLKLIKLSEGEINKLPFPKTARLLGGVISENITIDKKSIDTAKKYLEKHRLNKKL